MDGKNLDSHYVEYPVDIFGADEYKFRLSFGRNYFSADQIVIDIRQEILTIRADLKFRHLRPWPVSLMSPGIMGWYAWVPFMECFHGIISLDHSIEGTLEYDGRKIDFTNGRGYTEKDWGRAFPEGWIWQQSNHFQEEGVSLTASIAIIPWIGRSFPGFIIGLYWDNRLYRFATYTGARTKHLKVEEKTIHWIVEDRRYELEMFTSRGPGAYLRAPAPEGMVKHITESVDSTVNVRMSKKIKTGKTLVFQGDGRQAGLEVEGNISRLIKMVETRN